MTAVGFQLSACKKKMFSIDGIAPVCLLLLLKLRYLLRNATRVLQINTIGGEKTLALVNSSKNEFLSSSTASDIMMSDVSSESEFGSIGSSQTSNDDGGRRNTDSADKALPTQSGMECRIRRLEMGRRQAEGKRRAAAFLRLTQAANEYREINLTCDASELTSATSSFRFLVQGGSDKAPSAGLRREHVLALRARVAQEFASAPKRRRGSVQVAADAIRGSVSYLVNSLGKGGDPEQDIDVVPPTADHNAGYSMDNTEQGGIQVAQNYYRRKTSVSLRHQRPKTPQEDGTEATTLDEMLEALAGLAKETEEGPVTLTAFAAWWVGAVSEAEIELKKRFLSAPS